MDSRILHRILQISFFSLSLLPAANAQQRFRAGAVAGIVASQIDGDLSAGYNKLGLQAGIRVTSLLTQKTEASMEFLFSQRGSQSELVPGEYELFPFSLRLNYVEVPVMWHYKDWLVEGPGNTEYYKVSANVGLSYSRFISSRLKDELNALGSVAPDYLKKNDLGFNLGFSFWASPNLGFTFRFYRSVLFMYNPSDWNPAPMSKAWNLHCLNFQAVYML